MTNTIKLGFILYRNLIDCNYRVGVMLYTLFRETTRRQQIGFFNNLQYTYVLLSMFALHTVDSTFQEKMFPYLQNVAFITHNYILFLHFYQVMYFLQAAIKYTFRNSSMNIYVLIKKIEHFNKKHIYEKYMPFIYIQTV